MKVTTGRRGLIPACLALALLAMPRPGGAAVAQPAADPPLPRIEPKELAARIREARNAYDDQGVFEAAFDEVRDTNAKFERNQGNAEEQKPILVIFRGQVRYASNGLQWRAEYDAKIPDAHSPQLTPDHWISGFDGSRLYDWRVSDRRIVLHETHENPKLWSPRNLFWDRADELIDVLEHQDPARIPVAIKPEVVDGKACYVVDVGKAGEILQTRYVISTGQGYLPIRRSQQRNGKTSLTHELHDLREVAPGIWAPGRIEFEWLTLRKDGASRPFVRRSIRVIDYRPRAPVNPLALAFDLPFDVTVTDPRLGYSYFNDPWWPEAGALLLSRFDWPKTDLSPLGKLAMGNDKALDNQPPPPVRFASWVQTRFPHFVALTDKVVLLVFDDGTSHTRLELAPALKRLDSAYHAAGLEIILIEPPEVDVEELKQAVQAYDIAYAVSVDAAVPEQRGKTAAAFGVERFPAAVVIDGQGKVRAREGGQLVESLLPLLARSSGARELPRLSLERPQIPQTAFEPVTNLFDQEVSRALAAAPRGEITCRVVDTDGHAIAGARVTTRLGLTLLMVPSGGAFWSTTYRKALGRDGSTGPDGQLVLTGLCKGTYSLKVEAPGKAWAERKVSLNPELDPTSIEIMLQRGLAIAGQVRDENGDPVPGAVVTADQWEHTEDTTTFINSCEWLKPATVDTGGAFRFVDLPSGLYTFEVKAPGFEKTELKKIPAGKDNLTITLKRSE